MRFLREQDAAAADAARQLAELAAKAEAARAAGLDGVKRDQDAALVTMESACRMLVEKKTPPLQESLRAEHLKALKGLEADSASKLDNLKKKLEVPVEANPKRPAVSANWCRTNTPER